MHDFNFGALDICALNLVNILFLKEHVCLCLSVIKRTLIFQCFVDILNRCIVEINFILLHICIQVTLVIVFLITKLLCYVSLVLY